jgi:phosphatidylserine decarboxylase
MRTRLQLKLSHLVGWLADRRVPRPLRGLLYRTYARITGASLAETRPPLDAYPSLGAFFIRRLVDGARPIATEPHWIVSPVDGTTQSIDHIREGQLLQAKGQLYGVRELLNGCGSDLDLEGSVAWTIYLSPRDYHRIHAPETCRLVDVRSFPGARHSVQPSVLAQRKVLAINERTVLLLETARGPLLLVLVGALNVGRIRVVGVDPSASGPLEQPRALERGEELARFEMGSTIVLIAPPGAAAPDVRLVPGRTVRLGEPIGRWARPHGNG